jgi:hypothetical protein
VHEAGTLAFPVLSDWRKQRLGPTSNKPPAHPPRTNSASGPRPPRTSASTALFFEQAAIVDPWLPTARPRRQAGLQVSRRWILARRRGASGCCDIRRRCLQASTQHEQSVVCLSSTSVMPLPIGIQLSVVIACHGCPVSDVPCLIQCPRTDWLSGITEPSVTVSQSESTSEVSARGMLTVTESARTRQASGVTVRRRPTQQSPVTAAS